MNDPGFPLYMLPGQGTAAKKKEVDPIKELQAFNDKAKSSAKQPLVQYKCGRCGNITPLHKVDTVRCQDCGHRILFKLRTQTGMQYEAR